MFRHFIGRHNPNGACVGACMEGVGRREVNWDGVPDGFGDPNTLPADIFSQASGGPTGRVRGIQFSTPGTGFLVSADASNFSSTPARFGFGSDFERLFTAVNSNTTDVLFFAPETNAAETTGVQSEGSRFGRRHSVRECAVCKR